MENSLKQDQFLELHGLKFVPYLDAAQIEMAAKSVAARLDAAYAANPHPVVLLITLSGAVMFAGELSKYIKREVEWAFVKCSSYGGGLCSSGCVKFDVEPTIDVAGRDVLVVEDIVDTGHTWNALRNHLLGLNVASVAIATMLFKSEVYQYHDLKLDYVGLEVENMFLVGYGLDFNGLGRNINGVYKKYE